MYLNDYRTFRNNLKRLNESLQDWYTGWESKGGDSTGGDGGGAIAVVYDDSTEGGSKGLADAFVDNLAKEGSEKDVQDMEAQGKESLANFKTAMEKRKELDSGELRKKDGWYYGKGAWRINSNKIAYLGQTPSWMTWEDDLQMDILKVYFPELLEKGKPSAIETPEEKEVSQDQLADLLTGTGVKHAEAEPKYAMAEGRKLKYMSRITEQDEFTLGPPINVEDRARVVTPGDLQEFIVDNYKMRHRSNMMIWGAPGIGKTEIVKQAAASIGKELGKTIPVYIVTLAQMQPYDLNGIPLAFKKEGSPDFVMDLKERGQIHMDFAIPAWLPGEDEESEGILFFDEINRAQPDVLAAALTLLLDRKAQKYSMPPGWRVIAAGNRAMDGPVKPFEGAVASRFLGGHFHLVPSLDDWYKWARSDKAFYKDIDGTVIEEWFIPDEFIAFLKHAEKKDDVPKFFDLENKPIKTDFSQFYNYEKNKLAAGGEGVPVGFPTPRTWAIAWKNVYEVLFNKEEYRSRINPDIDSRMQAVSALQLILQNPKDTNKLTAILEAVTGRPAAVAFINYVKVLRRHSDHEGTLNDKLVNIFKDPAKPRPLVNIAPVKDPSERYSIMGLVESTIEGMGNKFDMKSFINWTIWLQDLSKKVPDGELAAHASTVISTSEHTQKIVKQAAQAVANFKNTGKDKELALAFKPFAEQFREILSGFSF